MRGAGVKPVQKRVVGTQAYGLREILQSIRQARPVPTTELISFRERCFLLKKLCSLAIHERGISD